MSENNEVKTYYKSLGFCSFGMGSNASEIDVKDGKIIRTRPLQIDKSYRREDLKPWKIEARGKVFEPSYKSEIPPFSYVYKKRAYSSNRIPYPMKREDWDPNGARNPQNRGKSKFVRISWDEATDFIASELKRIKAKYGPYSVFAQADGHGETKIIHGPHGCQTKLLELLGGYTVQNRQPDSWEGWYWGAKHMWGQDPVGQGDMGNMLLDIAENCEMMLFWGADIETTPHGWGGQFSSRYCNWLTELGIKQIYICPDVNYGCAVHADKWIPVLPNTDAALHLGIIYTWLQEDLWDKEFIATHAVGFDIFKKYVLGEEDGIPKTPKWAEPICGVPARTIKALAREWARVATTIAHCNGGSKIRSTYATEPARLEVACLAMQGMGKPGSGWMKFIEWQFFGLNSQMPAPESEIIPDLGAAFQGWFLSPSPSFIPKTLVPKAILGDYTDENPLTWQGLTLAGVPREDQFLEYQYPIPGAKEIHMIWTDTPCWTVCWNGGNSMIDALRSPKIECVVAQHPWMENDCLYADIILPINTKFEEEDIGCDTFGGNFNLVFHEGRCIEPIGESLSDWEAVAEVAKKLGLYEEYTQGRDVEAWIKVGFENSGIQNKIGYEEFKEKGYYAVPAKENWQDAPRGFELFYKDPENNPLLTPSGKIEFYSEELATQFPDDEERPPYPKFIPFGERHQESLLHPRSEKFPYLMVSNHPRWRVHANMDDISWLREIPTCKVTGPDGYQYEPLWINPIDAEKLGLQNGDVAKILNDRGWVLGGVYVTERIMPGVVYQDHGTRLDPIVSGESDRSGSNNLICPTETTSKNAAGEVTSGYLVNVEKVDVFALAQAYPEVFNRTYEAGVGICLENWIKAGVK
ncbi:MAG TPA: molybdopterin-dependent oxidoreductase [Syntrophomonas sp.]|nr:molybdopterin-dependent oxidoreductase [Syntrophomonas sp.]